MDDGEGLPEGLHGDRATSGSSTLIEGLGIELSPGMRPSIATTA